MNFGGNKSMTDGGGSAPFIEVIRMIKCGLECHMFTDHFKFWGVVKSFFFLK